MSLDFDKWVSEQAALGNSYIATSAGAVTLSTVHLTCTGLCLSNPPGSNKNLVVTEARFFPTTAPAGVSVVGRADARW